MTVEREQQPLPTIEERYRGPADLPQQIPVFPLLRAILLPRTTLPLNVFETRYLAMLDDVMSGARVLCIVQPAMAGEESPTSKSAELRRVGCVGRVTSYQETTDGRLGIGVTGVARCELLAEFPTAKPYRVWTMGTERFADDFKAGDGEDGVDRDELLKTLKAYLSARRLSADWSAIAKSSTEALVNSLAIMSPYGPEEKQMLLETQSLEERARALVALAQMELANAGGSSSTLQ